MVKAGDDTVRVDRCGYKGTDQTDKGIHMNVDLFLQGDMTSGLQVLQFKDGKKYEVNNPSNMMCFLLSFISLLFVVLFFIGDICISQVYLWYRIIFVVHVVIHACDAMVRECWTQHQITILQIILPTNTKVVIEVSNVKRGKFINVVIQASSYDFGYTEGRLFSPPF